MWNDFLDANLELLGDSFGVHLGPMLIQCWLHLASTWAPHGFFHPHEGHQKYVSSICKDFGLELGSVGAMLDFGCIKNSPKMT